MRVCVLCLVKNTTLFCKIICNLSNLPILLTEDVIEAFLFLIAAGIRL